MAITSGYTPLGGYRRTVAPNNTPPNTVPPNTVPPSSANVTVAPHTEPTTMEHKQTEPNTIVSSTEKVDVLQEELAPLKSVKSVSTKKNTPMEKKRVSKDVIQIRDFPRDVMDIVRGIVPGGNSYVETLVAFIYLMSPTKFDISPNVRAMVDAYQVDDPLTQVFKEIRLLREQMKHVEMTTYQTALASEYTLFHNLGLSKSNTNNPSDIHYLEPGVEDMHIALEEGAKQLKKKDTIRHGRR